MGILNELQKYVIEELRPISTTNKMNVTGSTNIDPKAVDGYKELVKDCGEFKTIDDALAKVFDAMGKLNISLVTDDHQEWLGRTEGDVPQGDSSVMNLDMIVTNGNEAKEVINASCIIEIYHTTDGLYELNSYIHMD